MKILLFGVSNVGKTTIGKLLAERIGFGFCDLDDEVKSHLGMTLEKFVNTADIKWRDQKRGSIIIIYTISSGLNTLGTIVLFANPLDITRRLSIMPDVSAGNSPCPGA